MAGACKIMSASNEISSISPALSFRVIAECKKSKARTSVMKLPHFSVDLPAFMPVGTQGTMKGLLPQQVKDAGAQLILGNTYHLGTRPGRELMDKFDGLHEFMSWDRSLLTDSGGFQMVSLLKLAQITEEGVKFESPFDGSECMLTPEESIRIQNSIGADIMMQLDDVVNVTETSYERFEVSVGRTTRWLDRCMKANKNVGTQNLFPIVQGGLFRDLRMVSLTELVARNAPGYAIGGLSGGENKEEFWPVVHLCTDHLPKEKPRYCMGVGMAVDLVVCCALGVDMFDCVYPTRTARFGCAIVATGQINLKSKEFARDFNPIDKACDCTTCRDYTRAYIHTLVTRETVACHLLSVHNIAYQMRLMRNIRQSIVAGRFEEFVRTFMATYYKGKDYPDWVTQALGAVNITLSNNCQCEEEDPFLDPDPTLLSGFRTLGHSTGFRIAILDDYPEAEERGRKLGLSAAFQTELNPTLMLGRLEGVFMALLVKGNEKLTIQDEAEARNLLKAVQKLILLSCNPSDENVDKLLSNTSVNICVNMVTESTIGANKKETTLPELNFDGGTVKFDLFKEATEICCKADVLLKKIGWKRISLSVQ